MLKEKKVLVTGGAGVIGKELVGLLKEKGAIIRVVDIMEKPVSFDDVEYFRCDLSHPDDQFLFRFEPEYVFHLAADFERSVEDYSFWDTNFSNNIIASHFLLKKIVESKKLKKIIFASSYLIYDSLLYSEVNNKNILTEQSPINPRNICGVAKLQTEKDIEFLCNQLKNKFTFACARIFRVYGRGSRDILSRWVRGALRGEKLEIFDKNNSFDYIYATDVAQGLIKIAESNEAQGIINLSGGVNHTIAEVADYIKKVIPSSNFKEINNSICPESSQADISKLKKVTGWSPELSLEEGIEKIITYEKAKI